MLLYCLPLGSDLPNISLFWFHVVNVPLITKIAEESRLLFGNKVGKTFCSVTVTFSIYEQDMLYMSHIIYL